MTKYIDIIFNEGSKPKQFGKDAKAKLKEHGFKSTVSFKRGHSKKIFRAVIKVSSDKKCSRDELSWIISKVKRSSSQVGFITISKRRPKKKGSYGVEYTPFEESEYAIKHLKSR